MLAESMGTLFFLCIAECVGAWTTSFALCRVFGCKNHIPVWQNSCVHGHIYSSVRHCQCPDTSHKAVMIWLFGKMVLTLHSGNKYQGKYQDGFN